jgi:serine/threonine protein kinase
VWALGCTLHLLLTDKLPYEEATADELEGGKFIDRRLEPPSLINTNVDVRLDGIVMRALAQRPRDRYANAQEMLADLEAWKPTSKQKSQGKESYSSELSKGALGPLSTPDDNSAKRVAEQAMKLARVSGKLMEAADLMEEAFTKSSVLRDKYDYFVKLWRQGKVG